MHALVPGWTSWVTSFVHIDCAKEAAATKGVQKGEVRTKIWVKVMVQDPLLFLLSLRTLQAGGINYTRWNCFILTNLSKLTLIVYLWEPTEGGAPQQSVTECGARTRGRTPTVIGCVATKVSWWICYWHSMLIDTILTDIFPLSWCFIVPIQLDL